MYVMYELSITNIEVNMTLLHLYADIPKVTLGKTLPILVTQIFLFSNITNISNIATLPY